MPRLTNRKVETAGPGRYSDGNNLHLLVTPRGGRSWVFRYSKDRRSHDIGIGSSVDVGLADARIEAGRLRTILREGGDPKEVRQRERRSRAPSSAPTAREFAEERIALWEKGWQNEKHKWQWRASLEAHAWPRIGEVPIDRVTVADIAAIMEPVWLTMPETASRLLNRLSRIFRAARAMGLRTDDPAEPKMLRELLPAQPRYRQNHLPAAPFADVPGIVAKIRQLGSTSARALELTILTAARSGEIRGMRWDEVDLGKRLWVVPASRMKMKKPHTVPLSDHATEIVLAQPRDSNLVFHGRGGGQLSDMSLLQCLRGVEAGIVVHGFRGSFSDWSYEVANARREVIEACLAHAIPSAVEAAYRRTDFLARRRELMDKWAWHCEFVIVPNA